MTTYRKKLLRNNSNSNNKRLLLPQEYGIKPNSRVRIRKAEVVIIEEVNENEKNKNGGYITKVRNVRGNGDIGIRKCLGFDFEDNIDIKKCVILEKARR